jgi:GrpB-like predicted nucleotidyltransferase (UPF0157 family)
VTTEPPDGGLPPGPSALPAWAVEPVHLSDYDPGWPAAAEAYAAELRPALAPRLLSPIEHVGSTSVPGLPAKPVIDLMALVSELDRAAEITAAALGTTGWRYVPPEFDGRPFRRFLARVSSDDRHRLAHLHLMAPGAARWDQQLAFRDALRADPALRDEYAAVKSGLARAHAADRERYTDEKATFVLKVLRSLGALSLALLALLVAGCGSSHPWWYSSGATSCGPPAGLRVAGRVSELGSCSGNFLTPARQVTLNVGDTIDIHMQQEAGGPSGSSPVPVPSALLPAVSGSSAVKRTAANSAQATTTFRAVHRGRATLIIPGRCLLDGHRRTGCPVLNITVR